MSKIVEKIEHSIENFEKKIVPTQEYRDKPRQLIVDLIHLICKKEYHTKDITFWSTYCSTLKREAFDLAFLVENRSVYKLLFLKFNDGFDK